MDFILVILMLLLAGSSAARLLYIPSIIQQCELNIKNSNKPGVFKIVSHKKAREVLLGIPPQYLYINNIIYNGKVSRNGGILWYKGAPYFFEDLEEIQDCNFSSIYERN